MQQQPHSGGPPPGQYGPPPGQGQPGPPPGPPPGHQGNPNTMQPMAGMQPQQQQQWMARPNAKPGCPPGLEYLTSIDQLLVQQQIELLEVITNFETENKYKITNSLGQQVYYAKEESDACHRQCCGSNRGFTMTITDNVGQEVIRVIREFKCCGGHPCCACGDCCASEVSVEAPPGQTVGYVRQQQSCCEPKFSIQDANRDPNLRITGPVCFCQGPCCTKDIEFLVLNDIGDQVGKISKQWAGYVQEAFTNANNFGISFPMDLDVKAKAVMVGAVFIIVSLSIVQSWADWERIS